MKTDTTPNKLEDDIEIMRRAANTLIEFFDHAIPASKEFAAAERKYSAMVDKINPAVLLYTKTHDKLLFKMGMNDFFTMNK